MHAYSRVWLHLVWATIERRALLPKPAAAKLSAYLHEYSQSKGIYMKINFVNADHVHASVDLPTNVCVEEMMQLLKGGSSHWINESNLIPGKFGWGRGYGVFSVSQSGVADVAHYIATQDEHHQKAKFTDELKSLVTRYGLEWRNDDENR